MLSRALIVLHCYIPLRMSNCYIDYSESSSITYLPGNEPPKDMTIRDQDIDLKEWDCESRTMVLISN